MSHDVRIAPAHGSHGDAIAWCRDCGWTANDAGQTAQQAFDAAARHAVGADTTED